VKEKNPKNEFRKRRKKEEKRERERERERQREKGRESYWSLSTFAARLCKYQC
jgi:hypothetical protein